MFGYIRPWECELRVREDKEYKGYYCGLCQSIRRRYGTLARLALNYDCAFLCAFLSEHEGDTVFEQRRCGLHPFRGREAMSAPSPAMDYGADVNVLLFWLSLEDRWMDEHRFSAFLTRALFKPAYRKAASFQPALTRQVEKALTSLHKLEKEKAVCTDEPSDAFGTLMKAVVESAPYLEGQDKEAAGWMFYNLGRWIYLVDAWDDREKDEKQGAYNVMNLAGTDREQAEYLLYISLAQAEKGYDLVEMEGPHGLVDNIMHDGCRMVTRRLLKEDKESMHESL